jgi:hypothetical protein
VRRAARLAGVAAAAAVMIGLVASLALTGRPPGSHDIDTFEPRGIVMAPPAAIVSTEIRSGTDRIALRRTQSGSWSLASLATSEIPSELASHLKTALQFMYVSQPTRILGPKDYAQASLADFGLDPPAYVVLLTKADGSVFVADFGALNPANTSQYVRLVGQPRLYLMARHVGAEWELTADIAKRILPPDRKADGAAMADGATAGALLLPASIDRIWAVEIVYEGKLHRFERDGTGQWLLHVGQHTHLNNTATHVADPAQAHVIATALAGFDHTQIEASVAHNPDASRLERYGLGRPALIAVLYARDNSSALARIEFGNLADDGFARYARVSGSGDVVTIAAYEAGRLTDLLKAVGAGS